MPDKILSLFNGLQTWSSNGQRAPHKPLLVLWAIGRCLRGEEQFVSYREADRELTKLLGSFGPHRKTIHTEAPFWRLQNDKVWVIPQADRITVGTGGNAHKSSLLRENAHGGFPTEIHNTLQKDNELASQLASILVDAHFALSIREDVLRSVGIVPRYEVSRRRHRDPSFSPKVLRAYGFRCAVCDFAVRINDEPIALEAAHIKWHEYRGPDVVRNGLSLCALHHRLFDKGAFTLSLDRKVIVTKSATGRGLNSSLGKFDAKPIILPTRTEEWPDPIFLKWHSREVFDPSV